MARKLLRQTATIGTALLLAVSLLFGVGQWRRSQDAKWCQRGAAGGVAAGEKRLTPDVLDEVHSACIVQRQRQRSLFGATWRTGGREAALCGFELARMQLISYHDREAHRAVLERYGVDHSDFEVSSRQDQDRFVDACLSSGAHEPAR